VVHSQRDTRSVAGAVFTSQLQTQVMLLPTVQRQENGYREYGPEALWMLEIISTAQSAGFALDEIRSLLPDSRSTWQHEALLESLQNKVKEIEKLQERLAKNKTQLLLAIDSMKNRPDYLTCADRPQWVLDQLRGEVANDKFQRTRHR
jgi:DNA-binding transcriptional MerR regulator